MICYLNYSVSAQVSVGSGSYTTNFPGTDAAGRNTFPTGVPNLSGVAATKPVPTNDWWSSFMKKDHGSGAFNYPLAYRSRPSGLSINLIIPNQSPVEYRQPMSDVDGIIVGVSNLNATKSTVSNHSDWTVSLNWTGGGTFNATMGVGMPFTYFTKGAADLAKVTVGFNPQNATISGNKIIITNNYSGANYVVYGPAGTVWSGSNGVFTSNLNGKNYWSMALLPPGADVNSAVADFDKYAFVFPGNTQAAWSYNASSGLVRTTFTVTPDVKEGVFNTFLQGLLPHQWSRLAADSPQPGTTVYATVRGQMKMLASNSFATQNKFSGILPTLPNLAKYSAGFDPGSLYKKIDAMKNDGLAEWTDSYNQGQEMNRLIQAAHIAHQIGHIEARDKLINTVKVRLEDWFKAEGGEVAFLFYYNNDWKTMFGYPAGHHQDDNINDHHFHWGYFIHAAAAIEQYQPGWSANWGPMVNLLIRDAASTDRNDTMFPYLRNFNVYQGHAWANGTASEPFGNDQESTSESMQFNCSLIHWGTLTGNTQIRDLGVFLYTTEQSAIEEYWFDQNDRTFQDSYNSDMVARVWGGGYDNGTWWSTDIAASYGIQLYPIHGGALYMGHNTAYVQKIWNSLKAKTGVLSNVVNPDLWYDIYWSFLSFLDPAEAIKLYDAYPNRGIKFGVSDAQTYHWLHTMNAMGQVAEEVTANYPVAAVFNKAGVKTYVAHNYGASAITVTYSDGFSMLVPARSTATNKDISVAAIITASTLQVPANGTVNLTAAVTGSGITKVDFYRNSTLILSDATAPYTATASNLAAGFPNFYARVFAGTNQNISNVVSVQVGSQIPYPGPSAPSLPGTIEAGNYDAFEGGSGQSISYSDATSWNEGTYRTTESVDAGPAPGEGNTVGWIDAGEWMEYTVNVTQGGTYNLTLRYTSGNATGGGPFWFENEAGTKISPDITVAMNDVNWSTYTDKVVNGVQLPAGQQVIRMRATNGGFNLGKMNFVYAGGNISVTGITVSTVSASILTGATQQLVATIAPANATNKNVTWTTSNSAVAMVNTSGLVSAIAPGSAIITVTTQDGTKAATSTITVPNNNPGLPSPWMTADIGAVDIAGSASHSNGTFTVVGSGADIWDVTDEFRYVYQPITGDVTITARVLTMGNTDGWAKAGVMIREGTAANAIHVYTAVSFSNGVEFQRRTATGAASTNNSGATGAAPYWVRLVRSGNVFSSFASSNGTTWTQIGSNLTLTMTSQTQVGLALTSHNDGVLNTSTFDNVTVTTISNVAVTGVTVSPTSTTLTAGGTQQLTATIAPANATNKSVTWTTNNASVATVSNSGLVTGVAAGSAIITVTTADGNKTATNSITVTSPSDPGVDITNLTGGIVSAQYDDSPAAERFPNLIDNNINTKYLTMHNIGWVQFQSPASYVVNRYTITSANDAVERDPLNWTLQGSTNGTAWTTIDTKNGEDFPTRFQTRSFSFTNTVAYTYYRLNLTNNSGTILQLAEFELFGTAATFSSGVCTGNGPVASGQSVADYGYEISTNGNVSIKFIPQSPIAGCDFVIFNYRIGTTGGFAGVVMTASSGTFNSSAAIASGSGIQFYFTYRRGAGGIECNSSATPHSYTVGSVCSGARMVEAEQLTEEIFNLYPNPVENVFTIKGAKDGLIGIFNTQGIEVSREVMNTDDKDVSHLSSGVYNIILIKENKRIIKRFIKK